MPQLRAMEGPGARGTGRPAPDFRTVRPCRRNASTVRVREAFAKGCPRSPADEGGPNAVELALAQSADVRVVEYHDDLAALGQIGAICRF